jgi:hypothetical protein
MQGLATSKVLFSGDNALVKQKLQKAIAILSGSVFPRLNKFFFFSRNWQEYCFQLEETML